MIQSARPSSIQSLWTAYFRNPNNHTKGDLLLYYQAWVARLAARYVAGKPRIAAELDDLFAAGMAGLSASIDRYDPARSDASFTTYAHPRVIGAFGDHLRRTTPIPRNAIRARTAWKGGIEQLSQELGRRPSSQEIDEAVGPRPAGLKSPWTESLDELDAAEHLVLLDDFQEVVTLETISEILRPVSLQAAVAAYLYFIVGNTLAEVGRAMSLSESRVSQIIKTGCQKIRAHYPTRSDLAEAIPL